jgi:L-amino acid N-acyltransferase YncA
VKIRSPRPEDNEELIRLDRISPEEGMISYYVDRRPTYIPHPDSRSFHPFVAEKDGRIAGVIFSALADLYVNGSLHKCDYISSLRVHPKYRMKGIGSALITHAMDMGKEEGTEIFWAVVIGKNLASFRTFQKCGFSRVGGLGFKVMTMGKHKSSSGALLREAKKSDLEEMTEIMSSYYEGHNFRPELSRHWLANRQRISEKTLDNSFVAVRNGRIVATLRAVRRWHTTRMIITKLSWKMKMASLLLRLGVRERSLLKMLDLTDLSYVPGEEAAAHDLMSFVKRKFREECRIAYLQFALGGEEEEFVRKTKGVLGHTDILAMSPELALGELDPIFPSR